MSEENHELKRSLKARHLNMIAIGGSIGTGIFLAMGDTLHQAGPGGALVAYALVGIMVYFLMTSLGEMATHMPISGSFSSYANKFIDPALGFALGWNYWYNWAITIAAENGCRCSVDEILVSRCKCPILEYFIFSNYSRLKYFII